MDYGSLLCYSLPPPVSPSLLLHPDFRQCIKISLFHRGVEKKGKWMQTERELEFDTGCEMYLQSKFGL